MRLIYGELRETFIMWFQDGGGRRAIWGREELQKLAKRFDFNSDEVLQTGETKMLDDDGDVIGGVYYEEERAAEI